MVMDLLMRHQYPQHIPSPSPSHSGLPGSLNLCICAQPAFVLLPPRTENMFSEEKNLSQPLKDKTKPNPFNWISKKQDSD